MQVMNWAVGLTLICIKRQETQSDPSPVSEQTLFRLFLDVCMNLSSEVTDLDVCPMDELDVLTEVLTLGGSSLPRPRL